MRDNNELNRLERDTGYLCTCFGDYVSALCPFHGIVVELPKICQIKRGGLQYPNHNEEVK